MKLIPHETAQLNEVDCTPDLRPLLELSSARHHHLCPRQILGVRLGLAGAAALSLEVPRQDKRLLIIAETDGCFISGVEAATGLSPNRRTLRIVDYGRIAATFVDVVTEAAVRVTPHPDVRERAWRYAKAGERRRYFAMLHGYQRMPVDELVTVRRVVLTTAVRHLLSRPGMRALCEECGEEVINERETVVDGRVLCPACAGRSYYTPL